MAAVSYDTVETLSHFSQRVGIGFPLLSDPDSSAIRAFGIFNHNVPAGHSWYGVPFPGMYVVDAAGRVKSKYFEQDYRQRFTGDAVLTREFGVAGGRRTEVRTRHLTLTTSLSGDLARRAGSRITLVADVQLPRGMHLYAPGAEADGYIPVAFTLEESPLYTLHPVQYPQSRVLYLPAIRERVPVYRGKVRFLRDLTLTAAAAQQGGTLELGGVFEYQACDDRLCYPPEKIPLRFRVEVRTHDRERVPEALRRPAGR